MMQRPTTPKVAVDAGPLIYGIDFETVPFEPGLMAPPPVCLAVAGPEGVTLDHASTAEAKLEALLSGDAVLVAVNAAYDFSVACAWYPRLIPLVFRAYDEGRIKDPLVRQKLIDIALGKYRLLGEYSLEGLVKRLANVEVEKADSPRLDFARYLDNPNVSTWGDHHVKYAKEDGHWHRETYLIQQRELEAEGKLDVLDDEDRQTRADFVLQLMSVWGLRTDAEGVEILRTSCETRCAELLPGLVDAGLVVMTKAGPSKKKAPAQELMLRAMGGTMKVHEVDVGKRKPKIKRTFEIISWGKAKLTKTGAKRRREKKEWKLLKYVSTDAEACADSGDDLLLALSEYTQLSGLLSGQLKVLERGIHEPLHTRFEVLMETGRTSSSGGNAGNVQNVRRAPGARECFKPRDGYVFVACDFDKAELHTLAQTCIDIFGRSCLGDALNNGYDPHTGLGARLAGTTYEDLKARIEAGDDEAAEWRQRAKAGNFGFPGGMGAFGMMAYAKSTYGVVMPLKVSEALHDGWAQQWPVVSQEYLGWIRQLCMPDGYANIKHFTSNRWRTHIPYCVAANSFFQGRAADGAKRALYEVSKRCYNDPRSALYGCRPVNFVHDEIIMEAPEDRASDAAWEMRDVMVNAFNAFTPDVPVRATPALMDRWSKKAKTLVNADGSLEVWRYAA